MFDEHGYPTDATLERIRTWPGFNLLGLFEFLQRAWHYPEYFRVEGSKRLLSTGGWSGNEDLIEALEGNLVAWGLTWVSNKRGGHYVFELPGEGVRHGVDLRKKPKRKRRK